MPNDNKPDPLSLIEAALGKLSKGQGTITANQKAILAGQKKKPVKRLKWLLIGIVIGVASALSYPLALSYIGAL